VRLGAGLDPRALAPAFANLGRAHVPGILNPLDAESLALAIAALPFSRSFTVRGTPYDLTPEVLAAMPPGRQAELEAAFVAGARAGFQYRFDAWRLSDVVERGEAAPAPLAELYDWLNAGPFLDFVRALTGDDRPAYVDAQATRYGPGDVLTTHDDDVDGKHRLYAYVLNLTADWRAEWGGLLAFPGSDRHLEAAYVPVFNALNIFRVPKPHLVTQVASFAPRARLSVTGWIRERR